MGIKTKGGLSVQEVLVQHKPSQILEDMNSRKEAVYHSSKREPLGKGYVRGHVLPAKTKEATFKYGKASVMSEDVGNILYPTEAERENSTLNELSHPMYVVSHGDYAPGEQRRRGYDWDATTIKDPTAFRFGQVVKVNYRDGVAKALNPALDETLPPNAGIQSKVVEDFKDTHSDGLGSCRNLGLGARGLPLDHTFGMPSAGPRPKPKGEEWDAAKCIHGAMTEAEQRPDYDLGRSVKPGMRNVVNPAMAGDPARAFGVPSIRSDIAAPRLKSVADIQNYGNEPNAGMLLYPSGFTEVNDDDFMVPYAAKPLQEILDGAGIDYGSEDDFRKLYAEALRVSEQHGLNGGVPLEIFRRMLLGMPLF